MAKKDFQGADFEEFFSSKGFEVVDYEHKRRSFGGVIGALAGIVALAVVLGGLVTAPILVYGSAAVQIAEPMAEFWKKLPEKLPEIQISERNRIVDKNGNTFAEIYTEDRIMLETLDNVSPLAIRALIDTEDKRFYEHGGIDPIGTARAALSSGGGSGITQQLVKNLQFYNLAGRDKQDEATEDSLNRKVKELKLAMSYEQDHSKDEILLNYFNTVAFGAPSVYSIESAANYFFGKPAKDLNLAEATVLVGSVKNPSLYNLNSDDPATIENYKSRQADVLARMVAEEDITQAEADSAAAEPLNLVRKESSEGTCASSQYAYYCNYVMDYLMKSPRFGESEEERSAILAKGGLTIRTYMDPAAIDAMNRKLSEDFGNTNRLVAPTAVVEPGTGAVVAMAQNREYGSGEGRTNINLAETAAATGSTYKMIALATAFENMPESALTFGSPSCPYNPGPNYDYPGNGFNNSGGCGYQAGVLDYKQATAWSSNTWFLTLATKVGMDKILDMSNRMGLRTDGLNERSLATVLGSKENTPISMAAAFATFANDGVFCPPTPVAGYEYRDGTAPAVPETYDPTLDACRSVMSPASASGVLRAMRANTYGEVNGAFGTTGRIDGYDAVGKSGTNQNMNLAWGQVSKNYAIFMDVYDMDNPNRGFNGSWRGRTISLSSEAAVTASQMLSEIVGINNPPRAGLNYDSTDKKLIDVPVDRREFFIVPSLAGMEPEQALATARALGIAAEVSKDTRPTPEYYPSGVVVEQSLTPGTQLPIGSKKQLLIYLGE